MNENVFYLLGGIGAGFLILFAWFMPILTQVNSLQETVDSQARDLELKDNELVMCVEEKEYASKRLVNLENKENDLQLTYNSLNTDFQACFFASYCHILPNDCEEYFDFEYNARDLSDSYLELCLDSYRDWDKYIEFDTDLT